MSWPEAVVYSAVIISLCSTACVGFWALAKVMDSMFESADGLDDLVKNMTYTELRKAMERRGCRKCFGNGTIADPTDGLVKCPECEGSGWEK